MLKQVSAHFIRGGIWFVHFVDRNDHGHFGRLRMVNGFDGLRHDRIIGRHDQNHNIGDLRPA